MGNHLGPFLEASDGPEGQNQAVWAVRGQGALHGVTWLGASSRLVFFSNPRFLGMGHHIGPFPEASDGPEGQEQAVLAAGGQGVTQLET